jgi:hypothetical protein
MAPLCEGLSSASCPASPHHHHWPRPSPQPRAQPRPRFRHGSARGRGATTSSSSRARPEMSAESQTFCLFSNCSDCLLTAALHQSLTGESHLARSLTKISHPSALASDRRGHTAKRTAFVQSPHTNSHHGRFHRRHVRCVHAHASRSSRRVATTSRDVWKAPTVGIDQTL